jgi:hypothetical protein
MIFDYFGREMGFSDDIILFTGIEFKLCQAGHSIDF